MARRKPLNVRELVTLFDYNYWATGRILDAAARLDPEHAVYHFISGYTSKIAGTEIGLGVEPEIAFSACFGAPFNP